MNGIIKWTATVFTVLGAVAVAQGIDPLNIYLFNLGSILWVWWAVRVRESSIIVVNVAMLMIYVYGFIIRI